nr:reverse transcriptase domain-containing protein [Tanacetum cinerariifolium]
AAHWWLEKETSRSIHTWEDLVSKFINEFFPPSRTTNLRNEISNFQQRFDESFHEAWDRYKDILHACPYDGFTELHQLDTFYNVLNPADQDSLNAAAGGNLLERRTQDVLMIIKNKSKIAKLTYAVNQQTSAVTTAMMTILKQFQATPPSASVKAIEEICMTCGGAHPYYQCLAAGGNTFPELRDNIQEYVSAAAVNYNQSNSQNQVVPLNELEKVKRMNEANMKPMQTQINIVKNELRNEMKNAIQASMSNQTNEIKNMIASLFQMNTASTSGSGSLPSNTVANPKVKSKPSPLKVVLFLMDLQFLLLPHSLIQSGYPQKVTRKLGDLGKFLIPCGFIELKCKALANLGASINLMPLYVWKKLGLPELISTRMTLELANRAICTLTGIARDVFVPVGKFTFPTDFVIVDYESDPRVPLILGRPFLQTARALIDVHGEEMILCDGDERLTLYMRHDTSSYSNQPQKESMNLINVFNNSSEDFLEDLFSTNQPSGNPTFSSHPELTLPEVKDNIFVPEGGNVLPEKLLDLDSIKDLHHPLHVNQLSEIEYMLHHDPTKYIDSSLKDSIDKNNLANLDDDFVDSMLEMFTDEHALDYSSPLILDEYDDDFLEVKSDTKNVYDDPFDSKGEKIKESKLLIDELDLPCDFFPSKYDSILSKDFSRVNAKPSTKNEDKVFNLGILIQENLFEIITRAVQDKKLASSNDSLMLEDFDPPLYELPFFEEVPRSNMLLSFSSENEEKVFKPGIYTSKKVHSSLIIDLSRQGYKIFKINQIFRSPMKIFLFSCGKDTHILVVPCLHFYPP